MRALKRRRKASHCSPESVLKVRDRADASKLEQARQMLADFVSRPAKGQGKEGGEER